MATPNAGSGPLDVVIVYAFDSSTATPAWNKVEEVYWLVHRKLTNFTDSCLGYIYVMLSPNNYTYDMKIVDADETEKTGYKPSPLWSRDNCVENMASGLFKAAELISDRAHSNGGIILFFSDGKVNQGNFFHGVENFTSKFPVHTFTVGGDSYDNGLCTIAKNSIGGNPNLLPVPDNPGKSAAFSQLLDRILAGTNP